VEADFSYRSARLQGRSLVASLATPLVSSILFLVAAFSWRFLAVNDAPTS